LALWHATVHGRAQGFLPSTAKSTRRIMRSVQPPPATPRLWFRRWSKADVELARALWGDAAVTALISRRPLDDGEVRGWLAREIEHDDQHGFQYWPMFLVDGDRHVGCCGLRPYRPRVPELGVHVRRELWGRGYATEAAQAVIAHAFELGIERLFAGHHPDNASSGELLRKLGFTHTHDELYEPTGLRHPSYELRRPHP
jgi:RimJ/RimL family protein N-acetyltransferase